MLLYFNNIKLQQALAQPDNFVFVASAITKVSKDKDDMSHKLRCEIISGNPREGNITWYHDGSWVEMETCLKFWNLGTS